MSRVLTHPYALLTLCVLFWSGNFVLARAMAGEIPPIGLAFWRWLVAGLILLPWMIKPLQRNWPLIRQHFGRMAILALLGIASFNTLVYLGLRDTTAINGLLMQSSCPLWIIALNWLLFRAEAHWLEGVSILISLLGVGLILGAGDLGSLFGDRWNQGDLWIIGSVLVWSFYSVLLRWRPPGLEPLAFLGFTVVLGVLILLPLWLWELSTGLVIEPNQHTLISVAYIAIFPSVMSYLLWNRAVAEIGANTAGHFIHLNPVFGSLLAVALLGEVFAWYHAAGAALVGAAIGLTVYAARR